VVERPRDELGRFIPVEEYTDAQRREAHEKQGEAYAYIERLASLSGTDLSSWNYDIFTDKEFPEDLKLYRDGSYIHTDTGKINEIFFERKRNGAGGVTITDPYLLDSLRALRDDPGYITNQMNRTVAAKQKVLEDLSAQVENSLKEVIHARRVLSEFNKNPVDIPGHIDRIHNSGFFKLKALQNETLVFHTVNPVIVQHVNDRAGVRFSVKLGRFEVRYTISTGDLRVLPYSDNIIVDGYYHPHVSTDGKICFGEILFTVIRYLGAADVFSVMSRVQAILMSYNDANPYVALIHFKKRGENGEEEQEEDEDNYYEDEERDYDSDEGF
jgi:hypothetical protein